MGLTNTTVRLFIVKMVQASTDFVLCICGPFISAILVYLIWGNLQAYIPESEIGPRLTSHFLLSIACVGWFGIRLRHYSYRKPYWFELKEILRTILIFAVIDLAIVAFSKWHLSRYIWLFTWMSILLLVPLGRWFTKQILQKCGLWSKPSVIIGAGYNAEDAYHALESEKDLGFDVKFFFATGTEDPPTLCGKPIISDEAQLWNTVNPKSTQFFIAVDHNEEIQRERWIKNLATHCCRAVSVIPTTRGVPLSSTDMSFIFSHEVLILRIHNNLTKFSARFLKRSFDILASAIAISLLSPLLITLIILVTRDGGNAIYAHERIGYKGRKFRCLKFRSMALDSEEILQQLLTTDPRVLEEWEKSFKLKNDPRITKLGQFIRKTSLDELPQLWNVLKGDMSLVGPRPIIEEELARYGDNLDYYFMAKPGMTGLWQVSGRNNVAYEARVYFDVWYVKNWSLWNDIAILFKTVNVVLDRRGAY